MNQSAILAAIPRADTGHNPPMQEIELKFQIPTGALAALQERLAQLPGHERQHLQAHYFDTPDRRLGRARSALRLRKEGERWVQTLKAASPNAMVRLEDNQDATAPPLGSAARPDLGRHLGTPVEDSLVQALGWAPATDPTGERTGLVELYRTDIWRHSARVPLAQGTIELALDLGDIHAGSLSLPVCELEIELVDGHPMAVIEAAREWVLRHGLWLDTRTKAHRGDRLARQAAGDQPPDPKPMTAQGDLARLLEQFTDRMSEVAQGGGQGAGLWRESLQHLVTARSDLSGPQALLASMPEHGDLSALARAPATTLLCLNLFASLL